MDNETELPTIKDVENQITAYIYFVSSLLGTKTEFAACSEKDFGHFVVAAWICRRHKVSPKKFLARLHRKHRKMEPGKVVPPHQLSTSFAEETAEELWDLENSMRPEIRAKREALLNTDISLEDDQRYKETIEHLYSHMSVHYEDAPYDLIYAAERELEKIGEIDPQILTAIKKSGVFYEAIP